MHGAHLMNFSRPTPSIKTEVTDHDRVMIARLIDLCQKQEGLTFPIPVEEMRSSPGQKPKQLLYYQDDREETLLGFVYLQYGPQLEVYGLAHPAYRRQGIGRALFQAAEDVQNQLGIAELLLVCDHMSPAGRAFAEAMGGRYTMSEHQMLLAPSSITRPDVWRPQLQFRRATEAEAPLVAHLIAESFGDPVEDVAKWVEADIRKASQRFFLGLLQDQPIGALRTVAEGQFVDIAAFGVLPSYRGQGLGRQMLLSIIDLLLEENWQGIRLDVETENDHALRLYQRCGFHVIGSYDYFQMGHA
jgi:ribosomal protein S18 acetylase RimI-like enzyme